VSFEFNTAMPLATSCSS